MAVTDLGYDIYQLPEDQDWGYCYGVTYLHKDDGSVDAYFVCIGRVKDLDPACRVKQTLTKDGEYPTLTFDVSALACWNGDINLIRVDFFDQFTVGIPCSSRASRSSKSNLNSIPISKSF